MTTILFDKERGAYHTILGLQFLTKYIINDTVLLNYRCFKINILVHSKLILMAFLPFFKEGSIQLTMYYRGAVNRILGEFALLLTTSINNLLQAAA